MSIRFVTRTVHAWLDYPVAGNLVATPFIVPRRPDQSAGVVDFAGRRLVAFVLTALTDHETGLIRAAGHDRAERAGIRDPGSHARSRVNVTLLPRRRPCLSLKHARF